MWVEKAKVHPDHHIQIARALYSVPTLYRYKSDTATTYASRVPTTCCVGFGRVASTTHAKRR
jgi:hypothetical protein